MGLSESFFRLMKVAPRVSRPYLILLGMEGGPFLLGAFEQSELRPQYAFEQSENVVPQYNEAWQDENQDQP